MHRLRRGFVAALAAVVAPVVAHAAVVPVTSNIAVNTTWTNGNVYWVQNSIAVNGGVTLTIQPGAVVKFSASRQLTVNGSVRAIGDPVTRITFTSIKDDNVGGDTNGDGNTTLPAASDWFGIYWPDASVDFSSRLHECDVLYGGTSASAALVFTSASDTISNCNIRRSYFGVDCAGTAAPVLTNTSIEASTLTPIVLDFTATPVFSSLVFSSANNGYDAFGLRGATLTTGQVATLPQRGATVGANPVTNVTYVLLGSLTINAGASLTINPGVVIKPISSYVISVFGNLTMNGTAAAGDTITITSINDDNFGLPGDTNNNGSITAPAVGNWGYVYFQQGSTGSVNRCRLKFGSNSASLGLVSMNNNSAVPVSNSLLSDAAHGLLIQGVSNPAVTNVAINNCTSTPILMSVSANPTYTNLSFLANAVTALGLIGEDIAVNSHIFFRNVAGFTNITYYVMNGQVHMQSPAILTIDPGVVIKNQLSGGGFLIDGGLIADGTPAQPIVFTSERDDAYGNPPDTNGDGSITTPAQANWTYIRFTGTTDDANAVIDNCRITYASYGPFDSWPTSLWITSAAPIVTNTFITKAAYGIRIDGNGTPTISTCDINNCSSAPIVMSVLSDPTIATNNVYSTNGFNALALIAETLSQDARIKYRPGVGTPTFAYLPTGTITVATGVTLTIDPQVVLKPSSSFTMFAVNGALNCVGSNGTTGRVIFTSRRDDNPSYGGDTTPLDSSTPQAGDWGNITFSDQALDAQCKIRNTLFQFGGAGGNDNGAIYTVSASPTIARNEFFQNVTAMTFAGTSAPVVDSTTILNCTQLPIVLSLTSNPQFPHPDLVSLANNTYTALGLLGETVAVDVLTGVRRLSGIPNIAYVPTSTITIAFGAKWTINPGIVLKFGRIFADPIGTQINIDGALVADGKPDSLIVFTSSADDAFGGDIRNDGALTLPAAGQWSGIEFRNISNDAATVVDHCRFRYGGYWAAGALRFISAGPTVTNSVFSLFSGVGTSIEGNSTPTFTNVNIDSCTNVPVNMSLVSEPVFNNVNFLGNTFTALGLIGESIAQDVLWRIRPVSGRNNMPYLLQAQLTTGLGATVTVQPGVICKMYSSGSVFVQRAFIAEGKTEPDSNIVFTSYRDDFFGGDTNGDGVTTVPAPSDWSYVTIDGTAIDPQVRFKNCVFRYGGSGSTLGALRAVNSSPALDSCLFANNAVGISVEGASNPTARGCSFFGNTQFAINNTGNSFCVNAEGSWWSATSGPNDASATADLCALGANAGTGDKVSNNVDYQPFVSTSLINPLIGDVSLNGQVLAYDASLTLQYLVALVSLSPLQKLVADVTGTGGISAFDASLILQYVAGIIPAFPAVSNRAGHVEVSPAIARRTVDPARGTFELALGAPERAGDGWDVPVRVTGTAPVWSAELELQGAGDLVAVIPAEGSGAMEAHASADGMMRVALSAASPIEGAEIARLRFADAGAAFGAPAVTYARVNETELVSRPAPPVHLPAVSRLGAPAPNPASDVVRLDLAIASADEGAATVRVLDLAGRVVRDLSRGPLAAGEHPFVWDLRDGGGRTVSPGLYFLHARTRTFEASRSVIVVR